ncbi:MAG: glycosyltransferase [Chthoniobacterales bacterium]|nr:glycosyltransferase [Chthoniobacterales bacterium]
MTKSIQFSVVTPSFNQLGWLELCIASVADQAPGVSVEHMVCDGGSSGIDDFRTRMLARHPATANYALRFEVGTDTGMYDAINKGLGQATGNICSYLNCDEQLLPGALEAVGSCFDRHGGVEVVFGDTIVVDRAGEALCYWRPYVPSRSHLAGATLNTLSCSTFFRRSIVEEGHLFDPEWKVVGDLLWIRGLLEKRRRMACLPQALAVFTFLGDNLGASAKAHEEFAASRGESGVIPRMVRKAMHAFRKFFSGAYRRRRVTYDIFPLSDPSVRRRYSNDSLGWTWPGLSASR